MKWLIAVVILGVLGFAGFAFYVRAATDDPAVWHVDIADAESGANAYALTGEDAPVFRAPPQTVANAFHRMALAQPRTALLGGGPQEMHATYVQRSELMAYPDYVTVQVSRVEGGARLDIFSRSRFGRSDLGVNAQRIEAWLAALEAEVGIAR